MISVTRNSHMPSVDDSFCCSRLSNWCWSDGWCAPSCTTAPDPCVSIIVLANACLRLRGAVVHLFRVVLLRAVGNDRRRVEVLGRRRRRGVPLEAYRAPRIVAALLAVAHRPDEVKERQ